MIKIQKKIKSEPFKKNSNKTYEPTKLKALSQVFLKDPSYLDPMIDFLKSRNTEAVLEIGPGSGILTDMLLSQNLIVTSVEKDPRFVIFCEDKFKDRSNYRIVHGDILDFDILAWKNSSKKTRVSVVGNIPYSISTLILEKLLKNYLVVDSFAIMAQKEFIEKILFEASPQGTFLKLVSSYSILNRVPRSLFDPEPKVDSLILGVSFNKNPDPDIQKYMDPFFKFLKQIFLQKKKKLKNILKALTPNLPIQDENPLFSKRPHEICPEEIWNLFKLVKNID